MKIEEKSKYHFVRLTTPAYAVFYPITFRLVNIDNDKIL